MCFLSLVSQYKMVKHKPQRPPTTKLVHNNTILATDTFYEFTHSPAHCQRSHHCHPGTLLNVHPPPGIFQTNGQLLLSGYDSFPTLSFIKRVYHDLVTVTLGKELTNHKKYLLYLARALSERHLGDIQISISGRLNIHPTYRQTAVDRVHTGMVETADNAEVVSSSCAEHVRKLMCTLHLLMELYQVWV